MDCDKWLESHKYFQSSQAFRKLWNDYDYKIWIEPLLEDPSQYNHPTYKNLYNVLKLMKAIRINDLRETIDTPFKILSNPVFWDLCYYVGIELYCMGVPQTVKAEQLAVQLAFARVFIKSSEFKSCKLFNNDKFKILNFVVKHFSTIAIQQFNTRVNFQKLSGIKPVDQTVQVDESETEEALKKDPEIKKEIKKEVDESADQKTTKD